MSEFNTTIKHYIGVDPSINSTGLAIISTQNSKKTYNSCTIKPSKKLDKYHRMVFTALETEQFFLANTQEGKVINACIEGPSNHSIGMHDDLGQIRGILKITLTRMFNIFPLQVPPTTLKKFVLQGGASKNTMIKYAEKAGWNIPKKHDDEADAAHLARITESIHNFKELKLSRKQLEVICTLGISLK